MASNPPFHGEDQTDEDFFDKLVEDDIEPVMSGHDDSDDAKALANLAITDDADADAAFGNSDAGEGGIELKGEEGEGSVKLDGGNAQEGNFSVPSSSSGCSSSMDHGNGGTLASSLTKSNGITSSEVKEVDWNSFHANSNGGVGFGSYSDFFSDLGDQSGDFPGKEAHDSNTEVKPGNEIPNYGSNDSVNYVQYQEGQGYDASVGNNANEQDPSSDQYWENLYPGWKFDYNTGQWYQVDDQNVTATTTQGSPEANTAVGWTAASDANTDMSYMQQTAQSVAGTLAETGTTESVSSWNQVSQGNNGYPEHMVFDSNYPDWYYDTITQEWRLLETYISSIQSAVPGRENGHDSTGTFSHNDNSLYREYGQAGNYGSQGVSSQAADDSWSGSYGTNHQQSLDTYPTETATKSGDSATSSGNQQFDHSFGSSISVNKDIQNTYRSFGSVPLYNKVNHDHVLANGTVERQSFAPSGNIVQHFNYSNTQFDEQKNFSKDYAESQKSFSYSQQSFQGGHQNSYAPHAEMAGRPPHALVTFGFGGKLIVMKDSSLLSSSYGSQSAVQGPISVLNLMEVVTGSIAPSSIRNDTGDYFCALSQQSFPGPLVGGSVGSKELYKWIDERIAHRGSPDMDYKKGERLKLLLSLLKIACQHYGKLRSPFGTDTIRKENDTPESAVAKLFASAKMSGKEFTQYGALSHCLQNLPSEAQMRATASEVQMLLVSGKKKEALQYAQEGQLWGPALVLASQLGDQFYVDTVKQMALRQLVAGSPLRTLCLLIAGQPAEVFSSHSSINGDPSAFNMPQQPAQMVLFGSNGMLDDWEENLAVITANRTKDDELVIIHLGDCLWKERSEITAAHICYLVAEANFESYSDSARLCLIGADHWKFPRTYASPEAIQRTELYEYSKVLGNSQFILLPFQPYKLVYAYMLAEVGKVSDSLKYCQAVLKSLKTGRAPEVETWKQLVISLEERIKTHQQGGYAANLAPAKLVGKLLNFFDSTAHRVVGGLPPPAPSSSQGTVHGNEQHHQPMAHRVSNSQSTMAMSSLVPSASMEWTADSNRMTKPNRSVSEPDFSRSPQQETSADAQGKAPESGGTSRFSRFGFGSQLLQKTVGLVLRPRPGRQAKLGGKNKFYYDEKLKRWVEEGAEPPAEETALPPPPTTAAFQNGSPEYNLKSALKTEGSPSNEGSDLRTQSPELTPGIPPIPPSTNHFSSRGRMGVRSRYVDTFNQGGGSPANLFQSPSVPSVKPVLAANAKFFIPAPVPSSNEQTMEAIAESNQEDSLANENPSTSSRNEWSYQSPKPASSLARIPSMGNISNRGAMMNGNNSHPPHSRRTASWGGGSISDSFSPTKLGEIKPLGEALGMPPSTYMHDEFSLMRTPKKSGSFGEDLHEVEL
ncbi:protein transport protein SEC16A homolog [Gastrolobium bilobum]|uniref:protein transport protein SEC16A homolog n=1 Tax=Gastrolobium bilobum TaxID=150636 RepID=UPI002AB28222|nr:protein transport protein SEC16A homolog [Gastrolobium bilobum]